MSETPTVEWEQSAELAELFAALASAQGEIEGAVKGKENPHFRSKYADLASVRDAIQAPLSKFGLCIVQQPFTRGNQTGVRTVLGHKSGQWMACIATTTARDQGPQAFGSCCTYLRRFSLAAVTGVAPEDDDGEKAEGRDKGAKPAGAKWAPPPANKSQDPNDDGTPITPDTLHNVRSLALEKFAKPAEAKQWLKNLHGTDNPEKLSEFEGKQAARLMVALPAKVA